MARRTAGVSGLAVLLGSVGIYLAYAGVKDVPLVDGLRSLMRGERPSEGAGGAYRPGDSIVDIGAPNDAAPSPGNIATGQYGNLGLVGNAAKALPKFKMLFPTMTFYGKAERPDNPSSDHPRGLAIDAMTTDEATAQRVIALFRAQPGAKYWIWNRKIANRSTLWVPRTYTGAGAGGNPHTDHVHMSFD